MSVGSFAEINRVETLEFSIINTWLYEEVPDENISNGF